MIPEQITLLIAEDDDAAAHLIKTNLKRSGVQGKVIRAKDGKEALDILEHGATNGILEPRERILVLLDVNMPVKGGIQVLQEMKSSERMRMIPVIMLTTSDDPVEINTCYKLGCNFFITKPVDYAKFVNTIKNIALILEVFKIPVYGA